MERLFVAASFSIESFEVSRSRLRRTRHHGVCVLNCVLVPAGRYLWLVGTVLKGSEEQLGGTDSPSKTAAIPVLVTVAMERAHLGHPGSPARVTSQEKGFARRSQVHVLDCLENATVREE